MQACFVNVMLVSIETSSTGLGGGSRERSSKNALKLLYLGAIEISCSNSCCHQRTDKSFSKLNEYSTIDIRYTRMNNCFVGRIIGFSIVYLRYPAKRRVVPQKGEFYATYISSHLSMYTFNNFIPLLGCCR
jgi:hypothetical protein